MTMTAETEKARKEIEQTYKLVRAEDQKRLNKQNIISLNAEKIAYGKTETKKGITNVVNAVLNTYKFASLPEFNAVLKQFNVIADRGKEEGRIYKHRGLVYRILDEKGNKIGVPVKASSINSQPTLAKLGKLFEANEAKKEPLKKSVKEKLDEVLAQKPASMKELEKLLEQKKIYTVRRQNAEGRIYGITFVDNQHKTVFNGSDLGKSYTAAHLQNSISALVLPETEKKRDSTTTALHETKEKPEKNIRQQNEQATSATNTPALDDLLAAQKQPDFIPFQLLKKKRKRKKRPLGL